MAKGDIGPGLRAGWMGGGCTTTRWEGGLLLVARNKMRTADDAHNGHMILLIELLRSRDPSQTFRISSRYFQGMPRQSSYEQGEVKIRRFVELVKLARNSRCWDDLKRHTEDLEQHS